ncbi:uncharacterized protein LOC127363527 [Dicentrarchus labrax]|uniref:uncharacterized protein LOC127363527 n=1 Tax=Dicentrarchus labrax TaxID=13489 RepID=UPI0021F5BD6B|nr:uncharacterized protein LOC127363527 [Dicentrarchus labrax]
MGSLKMWCLLPLAALLLLSIVPTVAEVVGSMSDCAGFLLEETPPHIPGILEGGNILNQNRYKPICQTLNNNRSFVTLYDTENKIPVFSAYKYIGKSNIPRPTAPWNIEPQLENKSNDKNMKRANEKKIYYYQAGNTDYSNSRGFNRGHLFPSSYASTKNDKISTFTLTNAVPQDILFNSGSWANMESCIRCVLHEYCINNNDNREGFLVTGAQPSTNNFLNNKINIPSMLWSAFCCYSTRARRWLASAHWEQNIRGGDEYLQTKTLAELHNELGSSMFPGRECPLYTTVTQLYPTLNKTCKCPPPVSTTSVPPTTTSGPLSTTSTPLSTTSAPLTDTSAPLTDTSAPHSTTSSQLSTTSTILSTTSTTFTDTSAPPSSTSAPLSSTSTPLTGTSAQPSSTSVPHSTTSTPLSTTSGPLSTTSTPLSTTSGPVSTTSSPLSTTSGPLSTTSTPLSTTSGQFLPHLPLLVPHLAHFLPHLPLLVPHLVHFLPHLHLLVPHLAHFLPHQPLLVPHLFLPVPHLPLLLTLLLHPVPHLSHILPHLPLLVPHLVHFLPHLPLLVRHLPILLTHLPLPVPHLPLLQLHLLLHQPQQAVLPQVLPLPLWALL